MAEPEDVVLVILKDLRAEIREGIKDLRAEMREGFRRVEARLTSLEDRVDTLEIRLDGLSHAMMSGFGSIVRELKDMNGRLAALEAERA